MELTVRPFRADAVGAPTNFVRPNDFLSGHGPLDLEIGCGVGWHPITYARNHPERRLIAIEHTREKFEKFRSRLKRHSPLPNLLPVHADAIRWVTHALSFGSIDRCLILYPNPEPKAPSQRWIRMPFFQRLLDVVKPEGEIVFATNENGYADEIREWAAQAWKRPVLQDIQYSGPPRTHFEKKYLLRGETCYEIHLGIRGSANG